MRSCGAYPVVGTLWHCVEGCHSQEPCGYSLCGACKDAGAGTGAVRGAKSKRFIELRYSIHAESAERCSIGEALQNVNIPEILRMRNAKGERLERSQPNEVLQ